MFLNLTDKDEKLVQEVRKAIRASYEVADRPVAVIKRIVTYAVRFRNKGKTTAVRRHPFKGVCEISGAPLASVDKCLDEEEPENGYAGKVRWTCPKGNNSGRRSCGKC